MNNRADVAAIATALSVTPQAVKKRAAKEAWAFIEKAARGGQKRFYDISSLPPCVQLALAEAHVSASPVRSDRPAGDFSSAGCDDRATGQLLAGAPADSAGPRPIDPRAESLGRLYEAKSDKQRAKARAALDIVAQYHELVGKGFRATLSPR
jgi:hypothetical protein